MTELSPDALAALHSACFETPRPWSAREFAGLLTGTGVFLICIGDSGFVMGRAIADEAEVLTLAVDPKARRQGIASRALAAFDAEATSRGATTAFLEVSVENDGARALYARHGWTESGRRRDYYHTPDGQKCDALILTKPLILA